MKHNHLSDRLVSLRKETEKTQIQVAQAIGISHKTLSKWELGSSEPDLAHLCTLAEYYGVSVDFLLGRQNFGNAAEEAVLQELATRDRRDGAQWLQSLLRKCPEILCSRPVFAAPPSQDPNPREYGRNLIANADLFFFQITSFDENLTLLQLPSEGNFPRLMNADLRGRIAEYFRFLSDPDAILLCRTLHRTDFSETFTLDYISERISLPPERTLDLLAEATRQGLCTRTVAHCGKDEVTVYRSCGDGRLLAALSLFCEIVEPHNTFKILQSETCKMIREDRP